MILQGASLDDPHASHYPDWAAWDNSSPFCPSPLHNMPNSIKKFRAWIKSKPWHDDENGKVTDTEHAVKFLIAVGMFARDLHAAQFAEEDDETLPAAVINTKHDFKVINETLSPLCEELLTDLSAAAKPRPRPRPTNAQAGSSKRKVSPGFFIVSSSSSFNPGDQIKQEVIVFFGHYSILCTCRKNIYSEFKIMYHLKKEPQDAR